MNRELSNYIKSSDFSALFTQYLGWNFPISPRDRKFPITIKDNDNVEYKFCFNPVAERSGLIVFQCIVNDIPTLTLARKCDRQLRKFANDYITIYCIPKSTHHAWIVPVKRVEKRDLVIVEYENIKQAEFLGAKLDDITFGLDEKSTIADVREHVNKAFIVNSEKVTGEFYKGFKKQHDTFSEFIKNLNSEADRKWYTSVMLNRLMFCYFIQKKGFLDQNPNYLRDKLLLTQKLRGTGKYYSFYKAFLRRLFSDGLNKPKHDREFESEFGQIPYLNGGMFDMHIIERNNPDLDIADEAFEKIFDFFDKYQWHLDTRLTASGKDINPDVLGYIFEQYINDRAAMGAYYTKEDITEYIGKNCIIPYLLDALSRSTGESSKDMEPEGYVWQMMQKSGDTYIYDAVKRGCDKPIPEHVAVGLDTEAPNLLERRARWNDKTPEEFALPTEIWRETIARRQRYEEVKAKIANGEICHANDLITYNLDMRQFAYDLIANAENPGFVCDFFSELQNVTILDPTCGSGAFLFAALNILEPLYEVCIDKLQEFRDHEIRQEYKHHLGNIDKILNVVQSKYRSNIQYYIYKTIILHNLYGVDIMREATEIAKLRLFLKLVAVVDVDPMRENLGLDPLPDIDFNIRCGNTLVGYATEASIEEALNHDSTVDALVANKDLKETILNEKLPAVKKAYADFLFAQHEREEDLTQLKGTKSNLINTLADLNDELNHYLHKATNPTMDYEGWLNSHQPFHWIAEFYHIIHGHGGFDVIIGNPPYLESNQIHYEVFNYKTLDSKAVHTWCIERSIKLCKPDAAISMIVPMALVSTQRMVSIQKLLEANFTTWYSNYAWRPAKLFDTVNRALSIFIAHCNSNINNYNHYTTAYQKWTAENRINVFQIINYLCYNNNRDSFWVPKLSSKTEFNIIHKVISLPFSVGMLVRKNYPFKLFYRTTGGLYWKVFTTFSPKYLCDNKLGKSSRETTLCFNDQSIVDIVEAILSSNLFWWWYTITSNLRDLNPSDILNFRLPETAIIDAGLITLSHNYINDIVNNSSMVTRVQKKTGITQTQSFKISKSKHIIDEIDNALAKHYGFTEEELDFIINYDIKYRMGDELDSNSDED